MAVRIGLVVLVLTFALVVESSSLYETDLVVTARFLGATRNGNGCDGRVGDCIDVEEEMQMESESTRRTLYQSGYIGYQAMKANRIPCSKRGASYYNCNGHKRVNPYRRGCSKITRCKRFR